MSRVKRTLKTNWGVSELWPLGDICFFQGSVLAHSIVPWEISSSPFLCYSDAPRVPAWLTHVDTHTHTRTCEHRHKQSVKPPHPTPTLLFSHLTTCQWMFMGHCLQCWWSLSPFDSITHSPLMDVAYPDVHWYGCPWPLGQTQLKEGALGFSVISLKKNNRNMWKNRKTGTTVYR